MNGYGSRRRIGNSQSAYRGSSGFTDNSLFGGSQYSGNGRYNGTYDAPSGLFNGNSDGRYGNNSGGRFNSTSGGQFNSSSRYNGSSTNNFFGGSSSSSYQRPRQSSGFGRDSLYGRSGPSVPTRSPLLGRGSFRGPSEGGVWAQADARVRSSPILSTPWGFEREPPGSYSFNEFGRGGNWYDDDGPYHQPFGGPPGCVFGYLGIHNMREGKSGLFIINYLNYLLKTRLLYQGPGVVLHSRLNDNNLELVFPSMELLRATVEKLSPIMVKGKIVVYVTYKPSIQNYAAPPTIINRRLRRPATAAALAAGRGRPIARPAGSARVVSSRTSARKVTQPAPAAKSKAQRNKNRLKPPRLRGVFPDGVQPSRVVMVVDQGSPCVSAAILRGQASLPGAVETAPLEDSLSQLSITKSVADDVHAVITGSSLSMQETIDLITGDPHLEEDDNLYVVVPSLAWLFKDVEAIVKDGQVMTLLSQSFASSPGEETALTQQDKPKLAKKEQKQERPQLQLLQQVISDHGSLSPVDQQVLVRPVKHSHYTDEPSAPLLLRLLLRRLVHTALSVRSAVRAVTTNSEVIFCGLPAHHMTVHAAVRVLSSVLSPEAATALAQATVESVRLFNVFAVNSWMLGGFKVASFNDKPYLPKAAMPGGGELVNGTTDIQANGDVEHDSPQAKETSSSKDFPTAEQLRLLEEAMPGDVARGAGVDAVTQVLGRVSSPGMVTLSPLALLDWLDETCSLAIVCLGYMKNLTTALAKLRHRGALIPWGPAPTEDFDESSIIPDIVRESVEAGIYSVQDQSSQRVYECVQCGLTLGGVRAADAHAYTRRHFNTVRWLLRTRSKESSDAKQDGVNKKSVLTGTATPSVFIPLKKEYIDRLVSYNVIKLVDSKGASSEGAATDAVEQRYTCVVCGGKQSTTFDGPGLRFHVHFHRHRVSLNNLLEVPVHRALVAQQENWELYCSLMRHPSLDVVLLADDCHASSVSLLPGLLSSRVHLVTAQGLLSGGAAVGLTRGLAAIKKRPAMWLVLAGCDVFTAGPSLTELPKDADQLLQPLVQLHAQLRHLLPADHLVVTAPLMPLQLLPLGVQGRGLLTNCLSAPPALHPALSDCYTALQKRSMRLHKATAQLCNIRGFGNLRSSAAADAVTTAPSSSVTCIREAAQVPPLVDTEWHIALRMFVSGAGVGLPTLLPRLLPQPHNQPESRPHGFSESELHSLISHATFICPSQYLKKGPRFDSEKPLVLEWQLDFKEPSVGVIRSKASATDLGNCIVWYLTCPVTELLLDSADALQCCLNNDCNAPLRAYFGPKDVKQRTEAALVQAGAFLTQLSSELPRGNFVSLAPPFPACVVRVSSTDPITHAALHSCLREVPSVVFTEQPAAAVTAALQAGLQGWADLIVKGSLHYSLPADLRPSVQVLELSDAVSGLQQQVRSAAVAWCAALNTLLRNHSSRLPVELNDSVAQKLGVQPPSKADKSAGAAQA